MQIMITPSPDRSLCVYTHSSGRYDFPVPPLAHRVNGLSIDYIWYSRDGRDGTKGWQRRPVPDPLRAQSDKITNRKLKMTPPAELQGYDAVLYVDGNKVLNPRFLAGIADLLSTEFGIGLLPHTQRFTVAAEVAECAARGLITPDQTARATARLDRMMAEGWPGAEMPLYQGNVILRRPRDAATRAAMEIWDAEFTENPYRDQFWLPYALWRAGVAVTDLSALAPDAPPALTVRHRKSCMSDLVERRKIRRRVRDFARRYEVTDHV